MLVMAFLVLGTNFDTGRGRACIVTVSEGRGFVENHGAIILAFSVVAIDVVRSRRYCSKSFFQSR